MSKYNAVWEYVRSQGQEALRLTFDEIRDIAGVRIDHSFLTYKKELEAYGYRVGKISRKEQTVTFHALDGLLPLLAERVSVRNGGGEAARKSKC